MAAPVDHLLFHLHDRHGESLASREAESEIEANPLRKPCSMTTVVMNRAVMTQG
jgi:hypothetical protein